MKTNYLITMNFIGDITYENIDINIAIKCSNFKYNGKICIIRGSDYKINMVFTHQL